MSDEILEAEDGTALDSESGEGLALQTGGASDVDLALTISANLTGTYSRSAGLMVGTGSVAETFALALTNGTGAGQADGIFAEQVDVGPSSSVALVLSNGLADLYGEDLQFSGIKALYVQASAANAENVSVEATTWQGPFGATGQGLSLRPGQSALFVCQDATGWPVSSGSDTLTLSSSAANSAVTVVVAGVSADVSAPTCSIIPAINGTPHSGSPASLTAGSFSGSPTFAYQWKRGGSAISGATLATYSPVSGDVGHGLSCTVTATNAAGSISVTTASVTVPS